MEFLSSETKSIAIDILEDCLWDLDWYNWSRKDRSCAFFFADELLNLIKESDKGPLIVIEEFGEKLDGFIKLRNGKDASVFEIGKEVVYYFTRLLS